jgi:hypothetical protein
MAGFQPVCLARVHRTAWGFFSRWLHTDQGGPRFRKDGPHERLL